MNRGFVLCLLSLLLTSCAPGHRAEWRVQPGEVRLLGGTRDGKHVFTVTGEVLAGRSGSTGNLEATTDLEDFQPDAFLELGERTVAFSLKNNSLIWWPGDDVSRVTTANSGAEADSPEALELVLSDGESGVGPAPVVGAGLLPDGRLAVCNAKGQTGLWDGSELVARIKVRGRTAGSWLSPDGKNLVLADPVAIHFFGLPEGQKLGAVAHGGELRSLLFSADGAYLAVTLAGQVKLIRTQDLSVAASLPGVASSVSFSADGRYFCATNVGSIDVWDLKENRTRGSVILLSVAHSEVLGEEPFVVTLRKEGVDLWSLDRPDSPVWSYRKQVRMMRSKPDGVWLYTASGWLESWRLPVSKT